MLPAISKIIDQMSQSEALAVLEEMDRSSRGDQKEKSQLLCSRPPTTLLRSEHSQAHSQGGKLLEQLRERSRAMSLQHEQEMRTRHAQDTGANAASVHRDHQKLHEQQIVAYLSKFYPWPLAQMSQPLPPVQSSLARLVEERLAPPTSQSLQHHQLQQHFLQVQLQQLQRQQIDAHRISECMKGQSESSRTSDKSTDTASPPPQVTTHVSPAHTTQPTHGIAIPSLEHQVSLPPLHTTPRGGNGVGEVLEPSLRALLHSVECHAAQEHKPSSVTNKALTRETSIGGTIYSGDTQGTRPTLPDATLRERAIPNQQDRVDIQRARRRPYTNGTRILDTVRKGVDEYSPTLSVSESRAQSDRAKSGAQLQEKSSEASRRERNKEFARRSRLRQKLYVEALENKVVELGDDRDVLTRQVTELAVVCARLEKELESVTKDKNGMLMRLRRQERALFVMRREKLMAKAKTLRKKAKQNCKNSTEM